MDGLIASGESIISYDGITWYYNMREGYYLNRTNAKTVYLHKYIYEHCIGAIAKGMVIHHVNFNKLDNRVANLVQLSRAKHNALHAKLVERNKPYKGKVICINDGVVYNSLTTAAKAYKANSSLIAMVCKGERKTTKGLQFAFYVEGANYKLQEFEHKNSNKIITTSRVPVKCLELNKVFASVKDAASYIGVNYTAISKAINGRALTVAGLHWQKV